MEIYHAPYFFYFFGGEGEGHLVQDDTAILSCLTQIPGWKPHAVSISKREFD